jgi:hypothetical protein
MTERQERFVEAFLSAPRGVRYNATRAAEAVGYRWPGKQGPRLLTSPGVREAVDTGFAAETARAERECQARRQAEQRARGPRGPYRRW